MTALGKLMRQWGCASLLLAVSLGAQAAPLNLSTSTPDILVSDVDATYAGGVLSLTAAAGATGTVNPPGGAAGFLASVTYNLTANISAAGVLSGGSISIISGGATLLAGTISGFGFDSVGGGAFGAPGRSVFEFLVDVTSSSVAGMGPKAGIIWSGVVTPATAGAAGFRGDSLNSNTNNFRVPTAQVPEPATLALLGLGCLALGRRFARRR